MKNNVPTSDEKVLTKFLARKILFFTREIRVKGEGSTIAQIASERQIV